MIASEVVKGIVAGVVATIVMDVVAAIGRRAGVLGGAPPASLGRWFAYGLRARFSHADIAAAAPLPMELPLALAGHYCIGALLGIGFLWLASRAVIAGSLFLTAVVYGFCTSVFAWFLMFPGMGYGLFGVRGPEPAHLFRTSVVNHLAYGVGLGIWSLFA